MKIYLPGEKPSRQASFVMSVAPAATIRNSEIPEHWLEADGKPRQFNIEFIRGMAEVEDAMGEYLLDQGLVRQTRLILPRYYAEEDPGLILG